MGRLTLRNVTERPPGSGQLYFRRKVAGKDTYRRLPAIDDPAFHAEYQRLSRAPEEPERAKPGTLAWLAPSYRASVEWRSKSMKTRANQGRYLDLIVDQHGHRSVKGVRPMHVFIMRDAMRDTPGKANVWLSVFGSLMRHAIKLGLRDDDPTDTVPILAIGEHEPWPAAMLRVCLDQATPMTRLAIVTGLCSGQRIGDCVRMQYGWIDGGIMAFTQEKVRKGGVTKHVAVPMHPFWIEELAALPRRAVTLLYERSGAPFRTTAAIQERLRALMASEAVREVHAELVALGAIDETTRFTFHGLRKNACCYLLECGLNDSEVGEILGMSAEMVRHYGKRARALMIARNAADRVTGGKIVPIAGAKAAAPLSKNG